ncbi:hypothetical protein [Brevibacillus fortis]|uniref:hypothetical protein n=1 Tax=Brevibacillus fortis TaxID=2126352 RepID=UPI00399D132D
MKETLQSMEIPFAIEQPSDKLKLVPGDVAFVLPDLLIFHTFPPYAVRRGIHAFTYLITFAVQYAYTSL